MASEIRGSTLALFLENALRMQRLACDRACRCLEQRFRRMKMEGRWDMAVVKEWICRRIVTEKVRRV
jgi:hypothetical protein